MSQGFTSSLPSSPGGKGKELKPQSREPPCVSVSVLWKSLFPWLYWVFLVAPHPSGFLRLWRVGVGPRWGAGTYRHHGGFSAAGPGSSACWLQDWQHTGSVLAAHRLSCPAT